MEESGSLRVWEGEGKKTKHRKTNLDMGWVAGIRRRQGARTKVREHKANRCVPPAVGRGRKYLQKKRQ
jgi:hypothetical protein